MAHNLSTAQCPQMNAVKGEKSTAGLFLQVFTSKLLVAPNNTDLLTDTFSYKLSKQAGYIWVQT